MDLQQQLMESAAAVHAASAEPVQGAVILGSGLGDFADSLANPVAIDYGRIPHFLRSEVVGHAGRLVIGEAAPGFRIACMQGRYHYYEGHDMAQVVYPVRLLRKLGASFLVVTNAAGGINADFEPGTLMLIEDHLNLTGTNPLRGKNHDFLGPRFPDLSEAYSLRLRGIAQQAARKIDVPLAKGVYAALSGPTYETPAEIRMLRTLGADAVGMSTVPEAIVANHMGMEVLGISCITNLAAGISPHKLSHQEVIETTERVRAQFVSLLRETLSELAIQSKQQPAQALPEHS